jgi:PAS domain S-box-containing protein
LSDVEKHDHLDLLRHQTTLAKFGELALRSDDLDEILTEACQLVGHALGTELAKVMELKEDGETLLVRAGVGWKPGVVGKVTIKAADNTSEGVALHTGEPMISPDIDQETRFRYPAFLTDNVLIIGGKDRPPFGLLQVDSRTPRQFTGDDIAFLRSYANLLATAVDRLRIVQEVRNGEARLRFAMEAGMLGNWDIDLFTGNIVRSPRYYQIFGRPEPVLDGDHLGHESLLDQVLLEDRDRVESGLRHAMEARVEWHDDFRIRRADDGEVRWVEMRGQPDDRHSSDLSTHLLGSIMDITDRKHAEGVLLRSNEALEARVAKRTHELSVANARLEEANARLHAEAEERERVEEALRQSQKMEAIGQLTGGIAHDFNNLLQGISGSLELMGARVAQGRTAETGRYIEAAMGSARRAATLTHRLLAFSRQQVLDPRPTDLNGLVGGMGELFGRTVGPGIRVVTSLTEAPWLTLCDPNQLENVLLNLVINARDAMPDGGELLIETANTVLRDRRGRTKEWPPQDVPPGDYMALSVADTGTGMAPDVLARAFDPFFTTKPIGQGTGLGLSMVYGFVQQSGGHVRLRSEPGHGTTVAIYLPRHLGAAAGVAAIDTAVPLLAAAAAANGVVLLVEDEPDVQMVVQDILSDLNYMVLNAESGQAGLDIVASGVRIDLLLTDVGLPGGMNGRQLADAARKRRPGLKVLFITGYAENAAASDGWMQEGMQVMTKPFALNTLAAKVQSILNG